MAKNIRWVDSHIEIDPPKSTKKLTATRFASVLGLNPWSSAFEVWCAVTKTWEKPFEDTKYTIAGKTIEPKQIEYMRYGYMLDNLKTPTDLYGKDYFDKTRGDFFPNVEVLGGMWDSLLVDPDNGKPLAVLEFKTTSRSEDWKDDVPEYYALQASLYAHLLGVERVIMICSMLDPADYDDPQSFIPNASNTFIRQFNLHERYPGFDYMVNQAMAWWDMYVKTGISPDFDEKKDAEPLTALRTKTVDTASSDLESLLKEAEDLKDEIDAENAKLKAKTDRLDALTNAFKDMAKQRFQPGDKFVEIPGSRYVWKMTKGTTTKVNDKALKADGLYEKYAVTSESYRMTVSKKGE